MLRFTVTPLGMDNYFEWSKDIELICRVYGLRKYVTQTLEVKNEETAEGSEVADKGER